YALDRSGRTRLQTQSYPPKQDDSDDNGRAEVSGELVIACGDAAPVLEMREGPLDDVASFVGRLIERMEMLAPGVVLDDRCGSPSGQELSERIAVVSRVGKQ